MPLRPYCSNAASTSSATARTSTRVRPHVGQLVTDGPGARRPSARRISNPTFTSRSGSSVSDTRIVSPMPSESRMPSATDERTVPGRNVPASVTPRWSGQSVLSANSRYAATVRGTSLAFTEIAMSRNPSSSSSFTCFRADDTSDSPFSRLPAFTPTRIGTPFAWAARATARTFSAPPMLPGLRRRASAPASMAASAQR